MNNNQRQAVINAHVTHGQSERQRWDRWHSWYLGEFWASNDADVPTPPFQDGDSRGSLTLETNYPYAFTDTMIANICPTNPQVTIRARNPEMGDAARFREALANDTLRMNKLHSLLWEACTHTSICGRSFLKTVWDKRKSWNRPRTYVVDPRTVFYDRSVPFEDIGYIGEAVPLKKSEFLKRTKKKRGSKSPTYKKAVADKAQFSTYPQWLKPDKGNDTSMSAAARDAFQWVVVYEFYDFESRKYLHFLEGEDEPLIELDLPYEYMDNPYDQIVFTPSLRDSSGVSDIGLIENALERLNEFDTIEVQFAKRCLPSAIINEAALDDPESFEDGFLASSQPGSVISVRLAQSTYSLNDVIAYTPVPTMSPHFDQARAKAEGIIDFVMGLPAYMRGATDKMKVATEGALVDAAQQTRNGRRIKVLEGVIASVSKKYIALWAQYMNPFETVPVRSAGGMEEDMADVTELAFDDPETFEKEWWFETECAPYSPTENNRVAQLQRLQQFLPVLANNPTIDQVKLFTKILELMAMSEIGVQAPQPAPVQMPGQPGMPGQSGQPGTPQPQPAAQGLIPTDPGSGVSLPLGSNLGGE